MLLFLSFQAVKKKDRETDDPFNDVLCSFKTLVDVVSQKKSAATTRPQASGLEGETTWNYIEMLLGQIPPARRAVARSKLATFATDFVNAENNIE